MVPLDDAVGDESSNRTCDDLIDAFMLPTDVLNCRNIANPAIRSFRKTIIQRAMDPSFDGKAGISRVAARNDNKQSHIIEDDPIATPTDMLDKGKYVLEHFRQCFPLEVANSGGQGKLRKKKYWDDIE
eukprot:CAMPEP_0197254016 /NCGR_PEP_ID=MMETSP1429-20130617/67089_1 /TAXON_ID=49237 /ORGANISM="Chaetoceros  sp., Strain UNC1202" /LENGTH=127 /DNA_ID=CAMNT_0042716875 /DNA_START=46 /DNA_END=429 /DNA_ORIENTATION=-